MTPRSSRLKDIKTFEKMMNCNNFVGLCKSQSLKRCIDVSTMLTQEPSYIMSWGQMHSLMVLLVKLADGSEITEYDKTFLKGHLACFATAWKYMTEEHPMKGTINVQLANRIKPKDGGGEDEGTDTGPPTTEACS
jgi:hypothetical protein